MTDKTKPVFVFCIGKYFMMHRLEKQNLFQRVYHNSTDPSQ